MRIGTLNWIIFRALADYKITCALPAFAGLLKLIDYMLLPMKPRLYDGKQIKNNNSSKFSSNNSNTYTMFRSTSKSRPNNIKGKNVRTSVRPSVHKKFLRLQ